MARANPAPKRSRRALHWPRRPRTVARPLPPILLPIEHRQERELSPVQALTLIAASLLLGAIGTEAAIALIRWSIPV